jgi:hypothetical protein
MKFIKRRRSNAPRIRNLSLRQGKCVAKCKRIYSVQAGLPGPVHPHHCELGSIYAECWVLVEVVVSTESVDAVREAFMRSLVEC